MGFLLLLPFFLIRFGLLSLVSQEAISRAAYFAPLLRQEKAAYWLYQISNAAIVAYVCFLPIQHTPRWLFFSGGVVYLLGLLLLIVSVLSFAMPDDRGMNRTGSYRLSRNPMYVAYFIFFLGCVLMTQSLLLAAFLLVFQITGHWIILTEERWCLQKFGNEYTQYMEKVRRYI